MQIEIQETLTVQDIMRIFHVSEATIYRWVAASRAGRGRFPLPIGGYKQKLCWSRDVIAAFQHGNNQPPQQLESASQRKKRHAAAIASLRKRGVNINREQEFTA
jgi:transposase